MDELEIKAEKITTELMKELADSLGEVDCSLQENQRHEIISRKISIALGIGFNAGVWSIQKIASKPVIQYNLIGQPIKLWKSLAQASRALNIDKSCIAKAAKGKRNTAGGFIWKYSTI